MKKLLIVGLISFLITGCYASYVNGDDDIPDNHEAIIKNILHDSGYSSELLENMTLIYLGKVEGYHFYQHELRGEPSHLEMQFNSEFEFDGYTFPEGTANTISAISDDDIYFSLIGILQSGLYEYGEEVYNLINESLSQTPTE